ncbi:helix-turn-helix domain-containing protein [Novosphingobium gossypii]|uniref:helix-turn-helix domain-containing protein n=1 Tax=Novosphingobium gossypii TaxID=1604774 RepID=UPI003D260CB2
MPGNILRRRSTKRMRDMVDDAAVAAKRLSPRQKDCLGLVQKLYSSKEIAAELGIGVGTVNSYISDAVTRLGARNRRHAAELLFLAEAEHAPENFNPQSIGVPAVAEFPPPMTTGSQTSDLLVVLPYRSSGATRNAIKPSRRFLWILLLVIACAIGFGMLLIGLDILSRFLVGT